jgi:1-acyl-sn-glycerol-3-phosphate acyltransferase
VLLGYFPDPVRFIAKRELAAVPVIGDYLRLRGILIDRRRGVGAREAIAAALADRHPWPILIFPEGTRTPDGTVQPFKPGGLRLIAAAGRPLVPVAVRGTFAAWPRHAKALRPGGHLELVIGAPVRPADYPSVEAALAEVERRVRALAAGQGGYAPTYFAYSPRATAGSSVPATIARPSAKTVSSQPSRRTRTR